MSENFETFYNSNTDPVVDESQIEDIQIIGEAEDDTPRSTYQERGSKAEQAASEHNNENEPATPTPDRDVAPESNDPAELSSEDYQQAVLDEILDNHEPIHSDDQFNAETTKSRAELIQEAKEKAKQSQTFREKVQKAATVAIISFAIIGIATSLGYWFGRQNTGQPEQETVSTVSSTTETGTQFENLTGYEEYDKRIDGSFNQYDNDGCYESEGKYSNNSVANPEACLELIGVDIENATPEEMGAAFEYVTYSQAPTAAFVATAFNMDGFTGLSYDQAREKIDRMSDDEKSVFQGQLRELFGEMEFSFGETSGQNKNLYIIEENDKKIGAVSTTMENGTKTLTMMVKKEDGVKYVAEAMQRCFNGSIKVIFINPDGSTTEVNIPTPGTPNIPPESPESPSEDTTEPTTEWGKSGDPHGGPDVNKSDQVNPDSEVSEEQNNNTNKGNQGNSNNKPGSSSGNSSNNDRNTGGEKQDSGGTNGSNSAPKGDQAREDSGNSQQSQAQEQNTPDSDNNTDSEEESRVAEGDF